MISERYFCNESDLISLRKVLRAEDVTPVRSRLMKAVFFLREESSEALTSKRSCLWSVPSALHSVVQLTFLPSPYPGVQVAQFACPEQVSYAISRFVDVTVYVCAFDP